jgi:bis(5'-nucleosyl)-tetraphosphatase (symmetrical)
VLSAPDCQELVDWLRHQPLIHQEHGVLLVHDGLLPQWTTNQAVTLAREVEAILRSDDFTSNLPFIYFRNGKRAWNDDLSVQERWGLATNVMTRIRVCTKEGVPDFSFKGPLDQIPQGLMPWFQIPRRANQNETIIFGHWSALGVVSQDNVLCLDGGCIWGKELVALRLEDRSLFRVSCAP